jgi:hypothetical protein
MRLVEKPGPACHHSVPVCYLAGHPVLQGDVVDSKADVGGVLTECDDLNGFVCIAGCVGAFQNEPLAFLGSTGVVASLRQPKSIPEDRRAIRRRLWIETVPPICPKANPDWPESVNQ